MFKPFFIIAMQAPGRQIGFRRVVVAHVLFLSALAAAAVLNRSHQTMTNIGYLMLMLGIVEGAALVGWRLTQLPKSQALEFLLTSPMHPWRVFAAEALVGVTRFALVWLSGLPVFLLLLLTGATDRDGLVPLAFMPLFWGVFAAFAVIAWVYEPVSVRRVGELVGLLGVLVYLVVGVVAGENLLLWLRQLPDWLGRFLYESVVNVHELNPFGLVRYWFASDRIDWLAWERFQILHGIAFVLLVLLLVRGGTRMRGHFHDRHYQVREASSVRQGKRKKENGKSEEPEGHKVSTIFDRWSFFLFPFSFFLASPQSIADRPLSWWAVRRVMEYSGRVNLWLAGGFCLLYSLFIAAGDAWPAWMGKLVFVMFEQWGGAPVVATAMVVLSAVPAVFQFGLWDPTTQERCRRLELLLLTELEPGDYLHASLSAAWKRGRGYLVSAVMLWLALGISGRNGWGEVLAASVGAGVLWWFSFAVGFRVFSTGNQTNGLASLLTLGFPLLLFAVLRTNHPNLGYAIPTGLCFLPFRDGVGPLWFLSLLGFAGISWRLIHRGLANCDTDLRAWYDANQGKKSVE